MLQLNPKQIASVIHAALNIDKPLMIWGAPGCGKSAVARQVVTERKATLIEIRLSQYDSVDIRGVPSVDKESRTTTWNPPSTLPFEGNNAFDPAKHYVLFFDEIVQAIPAVQAVAFQLVLDRAVGEHKLMHNVKVIAAGNRMADRAGANKMLSALANRFIHVEQVPHLDSWCQWAWGKNLNPLPIAFLRLRPDLLSNFDPASPDPAFASCRAWETVCEIVSQKLPTEVRYAMIAGTVGEGPAAELEAFMRVWEKMPNIDGIIMTPDTADIPTDPATLYAVCGALAQRAEKGNFDSIIKYLMRMPSQDYSGFAVKSAVMKQKELVNTRGFNIFASKFADMFTD